MGQIKSLNPLIADFFNDIGPSTSQSTKADQPFMSGVPQKPTFYAR
jgi:hypothetical protein